MLRSTRGSIMTTSQRILVLDFGSPHAQRLAQQVRAAGVYSEVLPWDATAEQIRGFAPAGLILGDGRAPFGFGDTPPRVAEIVFELGVPVLGLGTGMQAMVEQLGGRCDPAAARPRAAASLEVRCENPLLGGEPTDEVPLIDAEMGFGAPAVTLPEGFAVIAGSSTWPHAAIADLTRHFWGLQFEPLAAGTIDGEAILHRFVLEVCACRADWLPESIIERSIAAIRAQVGRDAVLLGLSGGVDSSVVAALLHRAIGDQLRCVFVDTGLMRLNEGDQLMAILGDELGVRVIRVDAEERFLAALAGVSDPEAKRKVIGGLFIEVFEEQAAQLADVRWLAQGTIYPDVIESAGSRDGKGQPIKSHHNVGGLPERMKLKLVEPLRQLFKDEVRRTGLALGLPAHLINRHPFPGPGLGVRILGEVRKEHADLLRLADDIFIRGLREAGLYDKVSQAFAVFLPVRAVGVSHGERHYGHVIALRAVETVDFMTARWADLPADFLNDIANRIISEVEGISRVVYDISGKPPATIEWE